MYYDTHKFKCSNFQVCTIVSATITAHIDILVLTYRYLYYKRRYGYYPCPQQTVGNRLLLSPMSGKHGNS